MKTIACFFSSWFLIIGGAGFILFSPWMTWQLCDTGFGETALLLRIASFMALGVAAVFSGVHLRELWRRGF